MIWFIILSEIQIGYIELRKSCIFAHDNRIVNLINSVAFVG